MLDMGIVLSVEDRLGPLIKSLDGLSPRRILAITASALTATATEAQGELKKTMTQVFDRPKPFTLNATFVSRATAERPTAEVGFREYAGKGVAAGSYLQAQFHGGGRREKRFEKALQYSRLLPSGWQAAPGPSARLDSFGNQSQGEIVKILSALRAFGEQGYLANRTARSAKRQGARLAQYFVVKPGDRTHLGAGIYQYSGEGHGRRILKVVNFIKPPSYSKRLDFEEIIKGVVNARFEDIFDYYAAQSIARIVKASL